MKIEGIGVALPSREVTNDDVLREIRKESSHFSGDLDGIIAVVRRMLQTSGSQTRRWKAPEESSLNLTLQACRQAMAGLDPDDGKIDCVICASVYRELIEPAGANLIAHSLGLDETRCFDLIEACDGWMTAAEIAASYIESGRYRRVMVVNGEFVMTRGFGIYPELFRLSSSKQLEWRFPAFTLGEAATATIFGPDSGNAWRFNNITRNDLYDRCSITQPWYKPEPGLSPRLAKDKSGLFTSYGADLRKYGFPIAVEMFKKVFGPEPDVDVLFTHSSSWKDWSDGARDVGLKTALYDLYRPCGNVVSAAIPAAMTRALEEGRLKRGMKVAAWVASAGMSFSTAAFTF